MDPRSSTASVDSIMQEGDEAPDKQIPREFSIANPRPVIAPDSRPTPDDFNFEHFRIYQHFVSNIIPNYQIDLNANCTRAFKFLSDSFTIEKQTPWISELMVRQFLLTTQSQIIHLSVSPSLSKTSFLHHELYLTSQLIREGQISSELGDFCDMLLAESVDLYHMHFSDVVDSRYWSKTKTVENLIQQFLKKEVNRLRLYNDYTFHQMTGIVMRKVLETAPQSAIPTLSKWADQNGIQYE